VIGPRGSSRACDSATCDGYAWLQPRLRFCDRSAGLQPGIAIEAWPELRFCDWYAGILPACDSKVGTPGIPNCTALIALVFLT